MALRNALTVSPLIALLALAGGLTLVACTSGPASAQEHEGKHGHDDDEHDDDDDELEDAHESQWTQVKSAVCVIQSTAGSTATGVVRFTQVDRQTVKIVAEIQGLKPGSKHGFHIHEYGDLTLDDGKGCGGHYNPEGHDHAGPSEAVRHAGDLGNLEADAEGKAHYEQTVTNLSVAGMKNPVVGRGMIVHAGTDDLASQPTGAAGARIGMGVIGIAKQ